MRRGVDMESVGSVAQRPERVLRARAATHRRISACRVCDGEELGSVLDLGALPLANRFLSAAELEREEPRFPLQLARCRHCGLVQLRHVVSPELLYREYPYFSSVSPPMLDHFERVASELAQVALRDPNDLVFEIGCNDGAFLSQLRGRHRILGCDPAGNVAERARERGVPVLHGFFDEELAREVRAEHGRARLVFAANVVGHMDDLVSFMRGVDVLLEPDGRLVIEVQALLDLVRRSCFDQIYHEHLSYFSLATLRRLLERQGFRVVDARLVDSHGASLQIHAVRSSQPGGPSRRVARLARLETAAGLDRPERYEAFAARVDRCREELRRALAERVAAGGIVAGYGASAKGNTLLNACGLGPETVRYIVDDTPYKQGRFAPGSQIPIRARDALRRERPDLILLLAWNYRQHILRREQALRRAGVRFLVPFPEPRVV